MIYSNGPVRKYLGSILHTFLSIFSVPSTFIFPLICSFLLYSIPYTFLPPLLLPPPIGSAFVMQTFQLV